MNDDDMDLEQAAWPQCPACGRRLFAKCPFCETPGNQFAYTETAWEDDREVVRVICPTCDEPFEPQFPPRCHGCGHNFDPHAAVDPPRLLGGEVEHAEVERVDDETTGRAGAALALIIAVLAGLGGYFVWLLR